MSLRLFALSDTHLSHARPKPMDVFGPRWAGHADRLTENWRDTVGEKDIVLVPGDISWAMRLDGALSDLEFLARLPGRKVLLRGNHDYWWPSLAKLNRLALPNMYFIHNNHLVLDGVAVGGSRLWDFPFVRWPFAGEGNVGAAAGGERGEEAEKIRTHELERLSASLGGLPHDAAYRVAMTHYPPLGADGKPTPLTDRIGGFDIDLCVFGHIHDPVLAKRPGEDVIIGKTRYVLVSSDHLDHRPLLLAEW